MLFCSTWWPCRATLREKGTTTCCFLALWGEARHRGVKGDRNTTRKGVSTFSLRQIVRGILLFMVSRGCHAPGVKKYPLPTPGVSAAGMVQRELYQRQEHEADGRSQSSAQGHLCEGNLLPYSISLFHLLVFSCLSQNWCYCAPSPRSEKMWGCFQSPINSWVKFLTVQLRPKILKLQGLVGQEEMGTSEKASQGGDRFC